MQRPIRTNVIGVAPPSIPEVERTTFVFWRAHSGQRMPTGVEVMQSGQIGRPQLEQATFVSRLEWR